MSICVLRGDARFCHVCFCYYIADTQHKNQPFSKIFNLFFCIKNFFALHSWCIMIPLIALLISSPYKSWLLGISVFVPSLHFLTLFSSRGEKNDGLLDNNRRAWVVCNHMSSIFFNAFFCLLAFLLSVKKSKRNKALIFGHLMRLRKSRQCFPSCSSLRRVDEDEVCWRPKKGSEELEWSHNSTHVISQLTRCFTNAMVGPRAWIGGLFSRSTNKRSVKILAYTLTPHQEQRLKKLQERLRTPFDETRLDHQEALRSLWNTAFPDVALKGLISEQWKEMGWQGPNPSTDFRGCGFISLENLLFSARTYPASFRRLLFKLGGKRATWEYPFAVAGINVSFMLIQMLDLHSAKPRCLPGINFIKLLGEDEAAFDVLFCVAFELMDAQWLAMQASYMEFNEVLQVTRTQLERELSLEDVHQIKDLPAYNLLYQ